MRGKFLDASRKRPRDRNRHGERLDAFGLTIGELAVDSLEIVEVMEHQPQRDAGAFGDARGGRAKVALAKEIEECIDDGVSGASGAGEASVEGG